MVRLHEQGDAVSFSIRLWPNGPNQRRVEGGSQLGAVEAKVSQYIPHILFSAHSVDSTDAAKDTPPTPALPFGEEDDISQRVYNLPIPSRKSLPDDYERNNNNDNEKYDKVKGGGILVVEDG